MRLSHSSDLEYSHGYYVMDLENPNTVGTKITFSSKEVHSYRADSFLSRQAKPGKGG